MNFIIIETVLSDFKNIKLYGRTTNLPKPFSKFKPDNHFIQHTSCNLYFTDQNKPISIYLNGFGKFAVFF